MGKVHPKHLSCILTRIYKLQALINNHSELDSAAKKRSKSLSFLTVKFQNCSQLTKALLLLLYLKSFCLPNEDFRMGVLYFNSKICMLGELFLYSFTLNNEDDVLQVSQHDSYIYC